MQISGFQKLTLLDYPDHLSALIFTQGCNFRCHFCHNPHLVISGKGTMNHAILPLKNTLIQEQEVFEYLEKRRKLIEGVVITGGEPTLQKDLKDFIKKVKKIGFLVKLDSNGSNPGILEELIGEKLINYIAMDLKSSLGEYEKVINFGKHTLKNIRKNITKSLKLIMKSDIDYEFRTTVLPYFHNEKEIEKMGELIRGAKRWYLQQFVPKKTLNPEFTKQKSFSSSELDNLLTVAGKFVKDVGLRK